jgi:hypothetical protein
MALNWAMLDDARNPVPIGHEITITTIDTGAEVTLIVPDSPPTASGNAGGSGGNKKLKESGRIWVTDQRVSSNIHLYARAPTHHRVVHIRRPVPATIATAPAVHLRRPRLERAPVALGPPAPDHLVQVRAAAPRRELPRARARALARGRAHAWHPRRGTHPRPGAVPLRERARQDARARAREPRVAGAGGGGGVA